jgi:hypothetical protein
MQCLTFSIADEQWCVLIPKDATSYRHPGLDPGSRFFETDA